MSIPCFIPSKDRAAQLNLLLTSLNKNAPGLFKPEVMYKPSNFDFDRGYSKIIDKWVDHDIEFTLEFDAEKQFYAFLTEHKNRLVCLFSDDCIFYRPTNVNENVLKNVFAREELFSFTYRLGKNITIKDYINNEPAILPKEYNMWGKVLSWVYKKIDFWQLHGFSVGYDGYVYRANDILELSEYESFGGIHLWEKFICRKFNEKGSHRYAMASPHESSVFVQQINVTHDLGHRTTKAFNISLEDMNNKLLDGYEIDLDDMGWENPPVNCTHGERSFNWRTI